VWDEHFVEAISADGGSFRDLPSIPLQAYQYHQEARANEHQEPEHCSHNGASPKLYLRKDHSWASKHQKENRVEEAKSTGNCKLMKER